MPKYITHVLDEENNTTSSVLRYESRKRRRESIRDGAWHRKRLALAKGYHRRYEVTAAYQAGRPCPPGVPEEVEMQLHCFPKLLRSLR